MSEFLHEKIDLGYDDLVTDTQPSGRTYITPDGGRFPSITTVLSILSEASIAEWRNRVGEDEANRVGHRASTRGTYVHAIVEKYLSNEDTKDYLPHIRQSLENLRPILDESITKIYGLEVPLYSRHLGVAGRCDCVAVFDGVPSIVDFKTSLRPKTADKIPNYFAQMADCHIQRGPYLCASATSYSKFRQHGSNEKGKNYTDYAATMARQYLRIDD